MNKNYLYIGAGVGVLILIIGIFIFLRPSSPSQNSGQGGTFGTGNNRQITVNSPSTGTNEPGSGTSVATPTTTVFEINAGPVAGATLIQMGEPTTTIARFVMQDTGHVFDLPLDSPGAVARAVSNTTIPGIASATWSEDGQGTILQYLDTTNVIKTLHLAFPLATTTLTTQAPVAIKFLPDGITSLAVSPDGKSVAYTVSTASGSNGYSANVDGTGSQILFSLPLSQVLLSWPSQGTLLAQTTAAAGVPGVLFSIDAKSGDAEPIVYADGLTAIANAAFSKIIYQITETGSRTTYVHDVAGGTNSPLSFDPLPEQCLWSNTASSTLYCAAPLTYVVPNFLDLWHAGEASAADSIFKFNVDNNTSAIVASPGGQDGGQQSDIASMAISPDDHYLIFVQKGNRSLWGVRLTQ